MKSSALIPEDDLLLKNSIEAEASLEILAKGNKKVPEKRKGGSIFIQHYRKRKRIKSELYNSPNLSFFEKCNNFQDHVTLNHEAQVENDYINGSMTEDGLYKLTGNVRVLLRDNLRGFSELVIEPQDDSDDSSVVTEGEYAGIPYSHLKFSNEDDILCILNTEDTIDYIPNSQLLDIFPENVLEDPSFHDDDVCDWDAVVASLSISGPDFLQLSEREIICILNTEDPEIPCNDDIILLINPSTSVNPQIATDSIDSAPSFTQSQMHCPELSSESHSEMLVQTEVGYIKVINQDLMDNNPSISDHNNSDSDSEIPCFPDIEALILKLDLEYAQESWITNEVARHQYNHSKRMIIRLKQSSLQRAMPSLGAFAVFYSRHFNYYIKKTEVTIGRSTDDTDVDIDLRKESRANMISRWQATIKMESDGSFTIKNLGKSSISINGKIVVHGQVAALGSSCLIQIRGMNFMFEINEGYVRRYLDNSIKKSQGKNRTFEWSPAC